MYDLFEKQEDINRSDQYLAEGARLLVGFAKDKTDNLLAELPTILAQSPWRQMQTPGGQTMSVAMSNCGPLGWISDRQGYRYSPVDPLNHKAWTPMPLCWLTLAQEAASAAGFANYQPDACLINRYRPGTRLSLHQDHDEQDQQAPIVSISLGLPATFLFGGRQRRDPVQRYRLCHGDVVVWGGPARFCYHGVAPITEGSHEQLGRQRINITFRKVY